MIMLAMEEFSLRINRVGEGEYEIVIQGEDDTIGLLLATYLELSEEVELANYTRPHPLREEIIVRVRLKKKDANVKSVLEKAINHILNDINDFRKKYLEALRKAGVDVESLE